MEYIYIILVALLVLFVIIPLAVIVFKIFLCMWVIMIRGQDYYYDAWSDDKWWTL